MALRGFEPNPCELDINFYDPDVAVSYRCYDCPRYVDCLDMAATANWRNFTCRACPVFKRYFNVWTKRVRVVR